MMNNRPKHLPAAFSNNQCHNNKRRGVNGMSSRVLVLGIGNVLWADEGFGVRAVEAFHERFGHHKILGKHTCFEPEGREAQLGDN